MLQVGARLSWQRNGVAVIKGHGHIVSAICGHMGRSKDGGEVNGRLRKAFGRQRCRKTYRQPPP